MIARTPQLVKVCSSQFVAELAQFSSLESQQNTVNDLNALMIGQATANSTAVSSGPVHRRP